MIRALTFFLFLVFSSCWAGATTYAPKNGTPAFDTLVIYSTLDEDVSISLIDAFQEATPNLAVQFEEMQSLDIYERVIRETDAGIPTADFVLSSAMDLQVKLVNDGYAQPVSVDSNLDWPFWASWQKSAFGLTFESLIIVYHKPTFQDLPLPSNREQLIQLLLNEEESLFGRIATYDIERSGAGFLFLARDEEHNPDIWKLVSAFGASGVKLYESSSSILERVADGRFALGYNILGSYAETWAAKNPDLGIIYPADYTVVLSRIGLVPDAAPNATLGTKFLRFLMSKNGQTIMARDVKLPAVSPEVEHGNTATALRDKFGPQLRPIPIGPGLVVYLDQAKRARFFGKWNDALRDN